MSDITASERRLSAALDRLDRLLETAPAPAADPGLIARLTEERDAALARAEATGPAPEEGSDSAVLTDLQVRLEAAIEQSARLSTANEELMTANRDLLDAQATGGIGPDETRAALEAEIAALRAARAAEMAQMSEIMTELERLLAADQDGDGPDEAPLALHATEAAGDGAGLPEGEDRDGLPDAEGNDALPVPENSAELPDPKADAGADGTAPSPDGPGLPDMGDGSILPDTGGRPTPQEDR
ncbi:hypothetical protein [Paracoccus gahaiensis]|uniref:hypothetical protein n=1 Tax=Paracoccus gahaiensis TaxID=1706839 RepID=UPI001B7FE4A3|nr:hypothetical protein [Paracoccus gahaiensis]